MKNEYLDKAWHNKSAAEVADAPIGALKGVTDSDGEQMKSAFGIENIRGLASLHHPRWAAEIVAGGDAVVNPKYVDRGWEGKTNAEIAAAPVAVLQGLSERQGDLLKAAFQVVTVADLAKVPFFGWAREIVAAAKAAS